MARDSCDPAIEATMHAVLLLFGCWVGAYVTLGGALLLLNIFSNAIGYDFVLHSVRKEAILAMVCSLIEGASAWAVATYLPGAARALIIPVFVVGLIYMVAHYEDWNRFDAGLVLLFQFVLGGILGCLIAGYFGAALVIAVVAGGALAVLGSFLRGL